MKKLVIHMNVSILFCYILSVRHALWGPIFGHIYISKFTAVSRRIAIDRTLKFQAVYKYTVGCTVI